MTLIQKLKEGKIPDFLLQIAKEEEIKPESLVEAIIKGEVVVPYNSIHSPARPFALGKNMSLKINVNIGTSLDKVDINLEEEKLKLAQSLLFIQLIK